MLLLLTTDSAAAAVVVLAAGDLAGGVGYVESGVAVVGAVLHVLVWPS